MKVWMLSQFATEPVNGWDWPVAASYASGHECPQHPPNRTASLSPAGHAVWSSVPDSSSTETWALVRCESTALQIEAAALDPRVQPYKSLWDPITPDTVTAYASAGATAGMILGQLLRVLAQADPAYMVSM